MHIAADPVQAIVTFFEIFSRPPLIVDYSVIIWGFYNKKNLVEENSLIFDIPKLQYSTPSGSWVIKERMGWKSEAYMVLRRAEAYTITCVRPTELTINSCKCWVFSIESCSQLTLFVNSGE